MTTASVICDAEPLALETSLDLAGVRCQVRTNSSTLIATLDAVDTSTRGERPHAVAPACRTISLQVEVGCEAERLQEQSAHFRGSGHLVFASFPEGVFVLDLLRLRITAHVSSRAAKDREFWAYTLLPISMGVLGPSLGIAPLHSACLAGEDGGLLIAGVSGAGKSTLALALAQSGFDLVSDDWTYMRNAEHGLQAHGLFSPVKLLPDAVNYFPQLAHAAPHRSMNGEMAFELAAPTLQARYASSCKPVALIFLDRPPHAGFEITRVDSQSAREFFERSAERLPRQLAHANRERRRIIESVANLPCYLLRYRGSPFVAARALRNWYQEKCRA
jgi:hypothetical protein